MASCITVAILIEFIFDGKYASGAIDAYRYFLHINKQHFLSKLTLLNSDKYITYMYIKAPSSIQ